MSWLTGLGPLELATVECMEGLGAGPDQPHVKCARIVHSVEQRFGYGRSYTYEVVCDLSHAWKVRLAPVSFHGNNGGGRFPPANPRYTEARCSPIGALALRAERGEVGPVPIGLINGTIYQEGDRPPLEPSNVLYALERLAIDPDTESQEIDHIVGPPGFAQPCDIEGDLAGFSQGKRVVLILRPRYAGLKFDQPEETDQKYPNDGGRVIVARDFPPGLWADDLVDALSWHESEEAWRSWHAASYRAAGFDRVPLTKVRNHTTGAVDHSNELVAIRIEENADIDSVLAALNSGRTDEYEAPEPDLRQLLPVQINGGVANTLRGWLKKAGGDTSGLDALRNLLS